MKVYSLISQGQRKATRASKVMGAAVSIKYLRTTLRKKKQMK
jgi:hypothetical protein